MKLRHHSVGGTLAHGQRDAITSNAGRARIAHERLAPWTFGTRRTAADPKERKTVTRCPQCGQSVHPATPVCPTCGLRLTQSASYADADPNAPPWLRQLQADQQQPYAPTVGNTARVPAPQPGMYPPQQPPGYQQGWPSAAPNGAPGGMPPAWDNGNAAWGPQAGPGMGQRPGDGAYQQGQQAGQQVARVNGAPLFDESALPDWLRQSPDVPQPPAPSQNGAGQAMPPAMGGANAFPPIEQAGQFPPSPPAAGGMPAHALLDSSALAQWAGGQAMVPAQPQYGMPGNDGLPAQSLVDEQALPQWLRAQPNEAPSQAPNSSVPRWIANPSGNEAPPSWLDQPFSGAQGAPASGAGAPWQAGPPAQQPAVPSYGQNPQPNQMSASQFVDESALPEWLKAQGGQTGMPAANGNGGGAGAAPPWSPQQQPPAAQPSVPPRADVPQGRFSASDLIDPNAMPQWARGGEAAPSFDSANGWAGPQQPSSPGDAAAGNYGRSSMRREMNGNGNGHSGRSQAMPSAQRPEPLPTSELPSWLQDQRAQQHYAQHQYQGYGANDEYGGYGGNGYGGNGWDDQQDQGYAWDEPGQYDQYGAYGGQQDPYGQPAGWNDDPYQQDGYPDYPNQGGYSRSQVRPRQAPQSGRRPSSRKEEKPRGWGRFFRRK